jgi:anti-anti-sigma factor
MKGHLRGQSLYVEEQTNAAGPEVSHVLDGHTARLTVTGELTEAARRPLVRTLTDLLLGEPSLRRVELDLRGVSFMNSAGMAVLVQLLRMAQPRGVEMVLVDPPAAVVRPLQHSGLWHRFLLVTEQGS